MEHEPLSSIFGPAYPLSAPFGLPRNFRTVVQDFPVDLATGPQIFIAALTEVLERGRMTCPAIGRRSATRAHRSQPQSSMPGCRHPKKPVAFIPHPAVTELIPQP